MNQPIARTTILAAIVGVGTLSSLVACEAGVSGNSLGTGGMSSSGSGGGSAGTPDTGGATGSGGTPGTGGATGSGGTPGTGGARGSGGTPGTGGVGRDAGVNMDAPASGATGGSTGATGDASAPNNAATQLCVDTINMYRATLGLKPYARWTDQEACVSGEALTDSQTGTPHSAFGTCTENAQDECPGWTGTLEKIVTDCLAQMWAEGPGTGTAHGHYINMSNASYTKAACGFATAANGKIWAAQNFK